MVDDMNIGFKSRKIRRNETGIYNVFVEWRGSQIFCQIFNHFYDEFVWGKKLGFLIVYCIFII
jgi:hypothetical protein